MLTRMLTRIADEKLIVFGAITDPQVDSYKGITGMGYTTVKAVKEGNGFRINGRKGFGTNSPASATCSPAALSTKTRRKATLA